MGAVRTTTAWDACNSGTDRYFAMIFRHNASNDVDYAKHEDAVKKPFFVHGARC